MDFPENKTGLLADTPEGDNAPPLTVSELSGALKRSVESAFGHVRVRGEISGFKRHASGHLYFTLKDDRACLDAVIWRGGAGALAFAPEDGAEVIATGKLTTYPGRSKYQIVIDRMELAGEGALMALLDKRRRALAAEGLFDADRKRPLPFLPRVIGVVTSPTGAVIRDILHRLEDRCPTHVIVWPVPVQGEGAAAKVAEAIRGFGALAPGGPVPRPDLLIVARGGGSIEDLWAFNEEEVVRAAAESPIPLISAVGHETDTTLIDHAADLRAPTPTAAAELAVPVRLELLALLDELGRAIGPLPPARRRPGGRAACTHRPALARRRGPVRAAAPTHRRSRRAPASRARRAGGSRARGLERGRAAAAHRAGQGSYRPRRRAARRIVAAGRAGTSRAAAGARLRPRHRRRRKDLDPRRRRDRGACADAPFRRWPGGSDGRRRRSRIRRLAQPRRVERKPRAPYVPPQPSLFDDGEE